MDNTEFTIGERIKKLREDKALTQQQLANIMGISKSSLAMYETNKREPNLKTIKKFCCVLETDGNYLIGYSHNSDMTIPSSWKNYNQLNAQGKAKADEYIKDLSENPKYTTNTTIADDITEELKQVSIKRTSIK